MSAQTTLESPHQRRTAQPDRPPARPVLVSALVSVSVAGVAWLGAVYAAPESFEVPMAWGAGVAGVVLCAAVVVTAVAVGRARLLQERLVAAAEDATHFAERTVPDLVARLRQGQSAASALAAVDTPPDEPSQTVLRTVAEEVGRGQTEKAAAMAACANAAGRMQALATGMLADLREMEHRHADPDVLEDLLHLDHRTAQAGRLADSIAVLTGARSGRRWPKPIVMESILRGAMGRIGGYQRVRLHCAVNIAVAGHAAEGVMHALAELLDNAANFSPPTAEVHVYVEEVPAGVVITVEDSGLVMGEVALRRAERAVSREHPLDLTTLSGSRLGLAVVGVLARKHGLSVSFRPSARGGTGALLMIPHELLTRPLPQDEAPAASAGHAAVEPRRTGPGTDAPPATDDHAPAVAADRPAATGVGAARTDTDRTGGTAPTAAEEDVEYGPSGLPKRRRGRALAKAHPSGLPGQAAARRSADAAESRARHTPERSAERLRAFQAAVRGPRSADESQESPAVTAGSTTGSAPRAAAGPADESAADRTSTASATSASHPEDDD